MKISITLLLFGITCVLAAPSCSQLEFDKCDDNGSETDEDLRDVGTEEYLNEVCRSEPNIINCQLSVIERCPNANFSTWKVYVEENKRVFGIFCDKSNPLRKKFINNSRCMDDFMDDVVSICNDVRMIDFKKDKEACKKLRQVLACEEKSVNERCGIDAKEAYLAIEGMDFQLRINKCL